MEEESREDRRARLQREADMEHSLELSMQAEADRRAEKQEQDELEFHEERKREIAAQLNWSDEIKEKFRTTFGLPVDALYGWCSPFLLTQWELTSKHGVTQLDLDPFDDSTPEQGIHKKIARLADLGILDLEDYEPAAEPTEPTAREQFIASLTKDEYTTGELLKLGMEFVSADNAESARRTIMNWLKKPPVEWIERGRYRINR